MNALWIVPLMLVSTGFLDETFDRAADAYGEGDYQGASILYEQIVSEGAADPSVFHNLGNTYYRQGRLGPAIANYERALHLDPGFDAARQNLSQCVRQTERRMEPPKPPEWQQSLLFWHYALSYRSATVLGVACWIACWMALALRQLATNRSWAKALRHGRACAVILGVVAVALGASAWAKAHPALLAVASQPRVPVYHGTSESEQVRFELFEGDRVRVDRRERGWSRVATAGGERGWSRDEALTFVGPPYERAPGVTDAVGAAEHPPEAGSIRENPAP